MTYYVKRRPQAFVGACGIVAVLIAVGLLPRVAGWFALVVGAIMIVSGLSAIFPQLGYVRFAPEGLTVKYLLLPARTVAWSDISAVTSERVRQIRHSIPSMVVAYSAGYSGPKVGQRLRDGRSYVGNFTTASGDELAAHGREYLSRYGLAASPTGQATPVPPSPQ
jgi:hypothetical protein